MYTGTLFHTSAAPKEKHPSPKVFKKKFSTNHKKIFFVRNEEIPEFVEGWGVVNSDEIS